MKSPHPRLSESVALQRCGWPACGSACCYGGAWLDETEAADLRQHAALLTPHLPPAAAAPADWFDGRREPDRHSLSGHVVHTAVVAAPGHYMETACIFLRPDHKCGLQVAGEQAALGAWRFKPFYCILHPLDLDEDGRITLDDEALLAEEPGSCLRAAAMRQRVDEIFAEELGYFGRPRTVP